MLIKNKVYIDIKTTHPIPLTFFPNFLSFDSLVFIFFLFCLLFNKLNSISCGICLSFKIRHLELLCKIIIQLSSSGFFLGLWSRGPPCNFIEQRLFLRSCEWLLHSFNGCCNHLINKCDKKTRQVKNEIIKHQIQKKN